MPSAIDKSRKRITKSFNVMTKSLQENFKSQQRFIADASHELRTPITIILGYADMLEKYGTEDKDLFEESVAEIQKSARNMQSLVDSMLFLARADSGIHVFNKINFEVGEVLRTVVRSLDNPRTDLRLSCPGKIFGDPEYLKIMFREIIANALDYSEEIVTVEVLDVDNAVEVKVIDRGIGINPEDREKIFDRFFRSDRSRTKFDEKISAGLGLAVAKKIADVHDVKIEIESTPGKGTTFILKFSPV